MNEDQKVVLNVALGGFVVGVATFAAAMVFMSNPAPIPENQGDSTRYGEPASVAYDTIEGNEDAGIPTEINTNPRALASQGLGDSYDTGTGKRVSGVSRVPGGYEARITENGSSRRVRIEVTEIPE